ncbi:hypothetical protein IQ35_00945 [Sphingobium wenxiniae]|uniref:Uncharacterized protein n=1 Tax=Sphingobium wenxiniae (strain DSM 21828 / CGMCC 1.7748 / JZ-1) TaxID=595605 RepID=A0A562KKF7_SPHWJ|nr:hypothetical protein IQ35_00945 [Sphingobium wenxiniae]
MNQPRFAKPLETGKSAEPSNCVHFRWGREPLEKGPPQALRGEFARAAYFGALAVSARLTAQSLPDPQLSILTDIYIHASHGVPYTVADASDVSGLREERLFTLIKQMYSNASLRLYRRRVGDAEIEMHLRIDLMPAKHAELSGYFARACQEGMAIPHAASL